MYNKQTNVDLPQQSMCLKTKLLHVLRLFELHIEILLDLSNSAKNEIQQCMKHISEKLRFF